MTQARSFEDDRLWSEGFAEPQEIFEILLTNIPNALEVTKATDKQDRCGTDCWVTRKGLRPLSIDLKVRICDPIETYGQDDLALETWSVLEQQKIGWTRNPDKETDYILWYFGGSHRWVLIPFPLLCKIFTEKWLEWTTQFKTRRQETSSDNYSWHSECVFVPRKEVWDAIYQRFGGQVTTKAPLAVFMP